MQTEMTGDIAQDFENHKFPCCLVWTPIPLLTWFFPFIGHLGVCTSSGVIRDFAGPYHVSTDEMAFGWPTRYLQLNKEKNIGNQTWDASVTDASEEYKGRMHNLFCDNCHSHVAMALNLMQYDGGGWNMVNLAARMFFFARYVGISGFLKTWVPPTIIWFCFSLFFWI